MQQAVDRMATMMLLQASAEQPQQQQGAGLPADFLAKLYDKAGKKFENDTAPDPIYEFYMEDILDYYVNDIKQPPPANFELIVMWAMLSNPAMRPERDLYYFFVRRLTAHKYS